MGGTPDPDATPARGAEPPGGPGDDDARAGEQLHLAMKAARKAARGARRPGRRELAAGLPVARVVVDKGLSHLDRQYDYAVPATMDATAQPGVRVRVRFGGRVVDGRRSGGGLVDGIVVERRAASDFPGALAPLERVLSPEPVFPPDMLDLARAVADRYAGTLADVVQLALPPRHARAEAEPPGEPAPAPPEPEPGPWERYAGGPALLSDLARGGAPRTVWTALPGPHWPEEIARAVAAALSGGRGALVVVPDGKDVGRVDAALRALLGPGAHVALTAGLGPEERYRRWLAVRRGVVRAVVGTRAAMFAPVAGLGLVLVWDDADSGHAEPRAPHPHVREVLGMRAMREHAAFVAGGHAVSAEAAQLVRSGWAEPVEADRATVRAAAPLVRTVGDADLARDPAARAARLPTLAWETARRALEHGPVLVQVPRRGYVPRVVCDRCRTPVRCPHCSGPVELTTAEGTLVCRWCARVTVGRRCPECGSTGLRAAVVGARRTAEELGRAFPRVPVRTSGRDAVLTDVPDLPAIVVATPGAEPVAARGYAAALLLDGWALLSRPDLRAGEDALRRWLEAASLVRPAAEGGTVVVVADPGLRPVQALVRWDPQGHARTELDERAALRFPPVARMASITGTRTAVAELMALLRAPEGADVLGPVPVPDPPPRRAAEQPEPARRPGPAAARAGIRRPAAADPPLFGPDPAPPPAPEAADPAPPARERYLLRVPPGHGAELARALQHAQAARAARRPAEPVHVRIDPPDVG